MARLTIVFFLLLGALLGAQYNSFSIPAPAGMDGLRVVEVLWNGQEAILIATDSASQSKNFLFRWSGSWVPINNPAGERFFSVSPSGYPARSLNRVGFDGQFYLKGWNYCFPPGKCGGLYTLKNGQLVSLLQPFSKVVVGSQEVTLGEFGPANPWADGSLLLRANIRSGVGASMLLRLSGQNLIPVADLGDTITDGTAGIYDSPIGVLGLFVDDNVGNPIKLGLLQAGRLQSVGVPESLRTYYDPTTGFRYNESRGDIRLLTNMAVLWRIPTGSHLASTISSRIAPYLDPVGQEIRNATDGQAMMRVDNGFETFESQVPISPASAFGCSAVIPIFRRQAGTVSGQLFKENAFSRLVVIRDADCQ